MDEATLKVLSTTPSIILEELSQDILCNI